MRGGFRRGRFDKVPQPGAINNYSEALYPPRVYHYYTQQCNISPATTLTIIVPSIDDDVGDSRGREVSTQGVYSSLDKRTPPLIRDFIGCFVDEKQYTADARTFNITESGNEPLNLLHYPHLFGKNAKGDNSNSSLGVVKQSQNSNIIQQIRSWEDVLGLPSELRFYSSVAAGGELTSATLDRLRIRSVKQKRIVKPVRRGAKVLVLASTSGEVTQEIKKVKRNLAEEDELEGGAKSQVKRDDDDREEDGGDAYEKEDDEASLSFQVDDDDDGGDLDGPEGSGGEDDFF